MRSLPILSYLLSGSSCFSRIRGSDDYDDDYDYDDYDENDHDDDDGDNDGNIYQWDREESAENSTAAAAAN